MSNHDKILQARIDIETAAEISHATRALETINEALKAEREKVA